MAESRAISGVAELLAIGPSKGHTYQIVKDVLLVDVDGDQCFVLSSLHARQFLRRDFDELVENVEEHVAGHRHDLLVSASQLQSDLAVSRPDHL